MLQQIVQKVHALDFLLEICAAIDIQRKGHILMSQNLGERFDVKLRYFDCSYCESVPDLVELYLLQPVSFQKTGKELPVCARFCWLGLILSILVYTFFSRMFDLMLPPVAKHSIVVA